jgi:amino acid permease
MELLTPEILPSGEPLETLFAAEVPFSERVRWISGAISRWLARVPAFWFAFAFTLTETVGAGILALPIAMAKAGPLAGAAILFLLGAINAVTVACMAEAAARSDVIRCGEGFLGRLAADYLGKAGSLVFTAGGATLSFLWLQVYYAGFSSFMAEAFALPPALWAGLLFAACLFFATRPSLRSTAASALIVGAMNILLILALLGLAFRHTRIEYLRGALVPFRAGEAFDPSILHLVFGVGLAAYFGHFSVGNCARLVLRRDPSGRGLIGGTAAAQIVAMLLYTLFVIATSGAVAPQALADHPGTALEPLARVAGPAVLVLGAAYATLAMGMAAVHHSLALFNLVLERLPDRRPFLASLHRQSGRLVLATRGQGARIGLAHAGLVEGCPALRVDVQVDGRFGSCNVPLPPGQGQEAARVRFDGKQLCEQLLVLRGLPAPKRKDGGLPLHLEVIAAGAEEIRLAVDSPMHARYEAEAGVSLTCLFELPDALWPLVTCLARREEATFSEVASALRQDGAATRAALESLAAQGVVQKRDEGAETQYRMALRRRQTRQLPERIWEALAPADARGPRPSRGEELANRRPSRGSRQPAPGALLLAASPLLGSFLVTEWLLIHRSQSFAGLLSFMGVILVSLLGGIFPIWLLAAGRRKGAILPGVAPRMLGNPLVMIAVCTLFLLALLVHGLFIWQSVSERAAALATAAFSLGATMLMARRGAFSPRVVIELRETGVPGAGCGVLGGNADSSPNADPLGSALSQHSAPAPRGGRWTAVRQTRGVPTQHGREATLLTFAVMADGHPLPVTARLEHGGGTREIRGESGAIREITTLRRLTLSLPPTPAREIKLWTHRLLPEGDSEPLPVIATVQWDNESRHFDLGLCHGQALLSLPSGLGPVTVTFLTR